MSARNGNERVIVIHTTTQDKRLHNTRLLLHRLGDLRDHIEESIWNAQQLDEMEIKALIEDRDPDASIEAIRSSITRTEILMVNVERLYFKWDSSGKSRRDQQIRRIIRRKYFYKEEIKQISKSEKISKELALDLLNKGVSELASRFFGIDGFNRAG